MAGIPPTGVSIAQLTAPASSQPQVLVAQALGSIAGVSITGISPAVLDPGSLVLDTSVTPPVLRALGAGPAPITAAVFIDGETPGGAVNGVNAVFSLIGAPNPQSSLAVYRNGVRQKLGLDYTLAADAITFLPGSIPQTMDTLLVDYRR